MKSGYIYYFYNLLSENIYMSITNWKQLLWQFLDDISLMTDLDNSENADQVKLMTIHASKWLEFPVVFIGWLEDNNFPGNNAHYEEAEMEEERRLMYVAITRAKDYLFLSHANSRQIRGKTQLGKPSRFIWEIPEEFIKSYNLSWWESKAPARWWSTKYTSLVKQAPKFEVGDKVATKLFGAWEIVDVRWEMAVVKMVKWWIKKLDIRFLEKA